MKLSSCLKIEGRKKEKEGKEKEGKRERRKEGKKTEEVRKVGGLNNDG